MRLAFVHPALKGPGGAESTLLNSARILKDHGHDVTIFVGECGPDARATVPVPLHILRDGWPRWVKSKWFEALIFAWKFGPLLENMDAVVCHNFPAAIWAEKALRRSGRRPALIWHCHEPRRDLYPEKTDAHIMNIERLCPADLRNENALFFALKNHLESRQKVSRNDRNRSWEITALKKFDLIWCNSKFVADIARSIYQLPVCVSYPPVALKPAATSLARPGAVGVLAAFAARKNLANSLRAMATAQANGCAAEFLVGSARPAEFLKWVEKHLPDLKAIKSFEIVDTSSNDGLDRFYSRLGLLIYVPVDEPLGLLPIEIARFGAASLLSDHGGPAEVAALGFGRPVDPFDHRKMAAMIEDWTQTSWPEIDRSRLAAQVQSIFGETNCVVDLLAQVGALKNVPRVSPSRPDSEALA